MFLDWISDLVISVDEVFLSVLFDASKDILVMMYMHNYINMI